VLFGSAESHYFLSGGDLFDFGLNIGPIALMALPLTFIVMTGEIDLSVASTLGLACSLLGYLFEHGWPLPLAILTVLAMGVVTGTFNGILVTHLGLPSLAVTIGTLTLYRGIAEIILGSSSVTGFPNSYDKVGTSPIPGTQFTWTLGIFIVLAVVFGVVLHATPLGRSLYAIGLNKDTAFFSGIRVKRIKLLLYTLSGVICAGAGILWTFQYASSRYDAGTGLELDVVTVVLFGGISIFGGKGTIIGGDHGRLRDRGDTKRPDPDQRLGAGTGGGNRVPADHQRRLAQLGGGTGRVASQVGTGCPPEVMNVLDRLCRPRS
jgi:rhamnose transport system permease protein